MPNTSIVDGYKGSLGSRTNRDMVTLSDNNDTFRCKLRTSTNRKVMAHKKSGSLVHMYDTQEVNVR
jgi:hypothetical protein